MCIRDRDGSIWKIFKDVGTIGLTYFVPIMAAYTAYSISDTPGIAPGFIVGVLAQQIDTGYLGALLGGILVGYATYMLMKLELPEILQSTWGFIAPVFSTLIVVVFMVYLLGPPISWLMEVISSQQLWVQLWDFWEVLITEVPLVRLKVPLRQQLWI